jgi:apolipoprotein N-acyltransferase
MYSMRATENARTVIRAANSGISAWVDPRGGIHDATELGARRAVVADVPISTERTPFTLVGNAVALLSLAFTLGAVLLAAWKSRSNS